MSSGRGDDPGREYEVNSHRAHLAAYVLIAGLILELINAIIWYRGPEAIAEMVAVLLIVGGVWGELVFANKARIAGDKQLVQYEACAAEANSKALEAQVELEKLKAPRLLSEDQRARITEKMRQFAGQEFSGAVTTGISDAWTLWRLIAAVLREANWVFVSPAEGSFGGDPPASIPITARPGIGVMYPVGPHIMELLPAAKALAEALGADGVAAIDWPFEGVAAQAHPEAIRIEIEPKT
jgi:hypothetical protein